MSDVTASPAAEPAVIDPNVVSPPNPVEVDNVDHEAEAKKLDTEAKAKEPAKKPSTREALENARKKMDAEEKAEPEKPKAEREKITLKPKDETEPKAKERDETGKFKGKEPADDAAKVASEAAKPNAAPEPGKAEVKGSPAPHDEPPARFSPEAKASWKDVPEPYRAETHRAINELQKGIEEHQRRYEPIKQYDDLAKQNGTTIDKALERYVAFDRLLNEDWEAGLESILKDKGLPPLRALAAHILDRKPEQVQARADQNTQRLERMVEQLTQQVKALGGHVQKTTMADIDTQVSTFAADKPWFDALQSEIAKHITDGLSLEEAAEKAHTEAQEKARALGYIPQTDAPAADPKVPAVEQTDDKGKKSITGAPDTGAKPDIRKSAPKGSIRDALRRAAQEATS